jgi:hypothetical protein
VNLVIQWRWNEDQKRDEFPVLQSEAGIPIPVLEIADWLIDRANHDRQRQHLHRYFATRDQNDGAFYTGQLFERYIERSDPRFFTPWDILAVEALSVSVPPETAHWLMQPDPDRDALLEGARHVLRVPGDSLWTCPIGQLGRGGALFDLYNLLREQHGLGTVTTSKLLAAKFSAVVPIRDSVVESLLGMEKDRDWWIPIRRLFTDSRHDLAGHLASLPLPVGAPEVSVLRRLDVVLWMEARARCPR